jgi:nicotinamidase/pyrazinamidase
VHLAVAQQLAQWGRDHHATVDYIFKGSNPFTEHYSAIQAEVPDADDPGTLVNTRLLGSLAQADGVVVAGEALSHCVANTVRDVARHLGTEGARKLTLLVDCTSSVRGFEAFGADFLREMKGRGMATARSTEFFP